MIWTITLNPAIDRTMVIDQLAFNEVIRAGNVRDTAGGKGVNVLRTIVALGGDTEGIVLLGGALGSYFRDLCDEDWRLAIVPIAGQTRLNVALVDTSLGATVKVNEAGPMVGADELANTLQVLESRLDGGWLAICGALPATIGEDAIAAMAGIARRRGTRLAVDVPNIACATLTEIGPDVVKVNRAELGAVLGARVDSSEHVLRGARDLRARTQAEVVIVGLGGDGAILVSDAAALRLAVPGPITAKPVGAGDALLAGFVLGIERGWDLERSFAHGMGAAIASARDHGSINRAVAERIADEVAPGLQAEGDPCR